MRRWALGGLVAAAVAIGIYWWHSQPEQVIEGPRRGDVKVADEPVKIFKGKELALHLGHPRMAAVMQVLESWLIFQEGKPQEAKRILKGAETVLIETDDYVTRGNVQSAYGRIARRQGRRQRHKKYRSPARRRSRGMPKPRDG